MAQRRPLTQQEFERLQQLLACMRMICDTPAILDPTCRVCPKLEELEGILGDLLRGAGPQDHRLLRMGADAGPGARARRRDGRRGRLAHRLGAAGAPARRDQPLQAGPGLPPVPVDRQRQRRAQPPGRERRDQSSTCRGIRPSSSSASPAPGASTRRARSRSSISSPRTRSSTRILHLLGQQAGAGRRRARRRAAILRRSRCRRAAPPSSSACRR